LDVYLIKSGEFAITVRTLISVKQDSFANDIKKEKKITVCTIIAGETFGEEEIFLSPKELTKRKYAVVCKSESGVAYKISKKNILNKMLLKQNNVDIILKAIEIKHINRKNQLEQIKK